MIIFLTLLIYFLDTLINNFLLINSNSIVNCYLVFVLLILVRPYFHSKVSYYVYIVLISILFSYNISSICLNIVSFSVIYLFINYYFNKMKFNLLNIIMLEVILFIIYLCFLLLSSITYYSSFNVLYIIKPLYTSIVLNALVTSICYLLIKKDIEHTIK